MNRPKEPKELDLNLDRMRSDVMREFAVTLRDVMRRLDDIDALDRLLNAQTRELAGAAAATARSAGANGGSGGSRASAGAGASAGAVRTKRPPRRLGVSFNQSLELITSVIRETPLQAKDILRALEERGHLILRSTLNRSLVRLLDEKRIVRLRNSGEHGGFHPLYSAVAAVRLPEESAQAATAPAPAPAPTAALPPGPLTKAELSESTQPGTLAAAVLQVVIKRPGLVLQEIRQAIVASGQKFPSGSKYPLSNRISWALNSMLLKGALTRQGRGPKATWTASASAKHLKLRAPYKTK